MRAPIQNYFQVGQVPAMAYAPALGELGWEEVVRRVAADDCFDAVEVDPLPNEKSRKQVAALAAQGHMRLCCNAHGRLLTTGLTPNDVDEEGRKRAEDTLLAGWPRPPSRASPPWGCWPDTGRRTPGRSVWTSC